MAEKKDWTARDIEKAIAPGLENLRSFFSADKPEDYDRDKSEMFLKSVRTATSKRGAENNELRSFLTLARQSGASLEELKPVFAAMASTYADRITGGGASTQQIREKK